MENHSVSALQMQTLLRIRDGHVSMINTGYSAFRVRGAMGSVVGRLVTKGLARWPKGPIGEQVCEITDAGRTVATAWGS